MPVTRALRTLTAFLDVAVFAWRRYACLQGRVPAAESGEALRLDEKTVVVVAEEGSGEDPATQPMQTVRFGLDGHGYEIDLSDENAAQLREAFARYIAAGRRLGRRTRAASNARPRARSTRVTTADRGDSAFIREWAREHGHQVSGRGPIPAKVRQAYRGDEGTAATESS